MTKKVSGLNLLKRKRYEIIIGLFFFLILGRGIGQNLISPFIQVYPKESYGYGTQNWQVLQSQDGLMLFANNDGLLTFDGYNWQMYPLSNRTILRSILEKDGKVYAGGQNELGYYQRDLDQNWVYHSLRAAIPTAHRDFEDVWNIVQQDETLFFRSSGKIFVYQNKSFEVWDQHEFGYLGQVGDLILVHTPDGNLYQIKEGVLEAFYQAPLLKGIEVRSIVPVAEDYLIATLNKGIFKLSKGQLKEWKIPNLSIKQPFSINNVKALPNGKIAIASNYNGLLLWHPSDLRPEVITSDNDLTSDGVINTCLDNSGNLWLGLENGLALVELSAPVKNINLVKQGYGITYDLEFWNDHLYIGTNKGLYLVPWSGTLESSQLQMVQGSQGQVWGLDRIDEKLFMSHASGLFEIKENKALPLFQSESSWLLKPYQQKKIMLGTYQGIYLQNDPEEKQFQAIKELEESSRFLEFDAEGDIWMSHPYRGIFRIQNPGTAHEKVILLGKKDGLPSDLHNHVFKINDQLVIAAERGIFYFDKASHKFHLLDNLNQFFPSDEKIRRLKEAQNGDIWFITESEIGYLKITELGLQKTIVKQVLPNMVRFMNGGWEKIFPMANNQVFITSINGLLYINTENDTTEVKDFPIRLNSIRINQDSTFYPSSQVKNLAFSSKENDLTFEVAAINFAYSDKISYQFYLEGFDEDWTTPDLSRTKEYTNLPYQKYTLHVRASDPNQRYSQPFSLTFEIFKPWYLSLTAKIFYGILAVVLAILFTRMILKRFVALENEMADTVKQSKEEIRRLENERIQAELDHKKRELVSTTIHIAKKNETIQELTNQLNTLKRDIKNPQANKKLQKVIHYLKTADREDEGWDQLLYHFNELHPSFFDKLKKEHDSLTPKDLKLCAYLKMNLTTKEIANLMNVSIRGIEASRYRLRKRLNLPSETNLNTFFMNY